MGFLNKKPNKNRIYSYEEIIKMIQKHPTYSVMQSTGGYRLIDEKETRKSIEECKKKLVLHDDRQTFKQRINFESSYQNIKEKDNKNFTYYEFDR